MPTAATNVILNPSAEIATPANYAPFNSATITRDTIVARFGDYSYKIVPGGTDRGIIMTHGALANTIHYLTFYVHDLITGILYCSPDNFTNSYAAFICGGSTNGWVRYAAAFNAAWCNGQTFTRIKNTVNESWHLDGIQLEASNYFTTYIDGNRGQSPIYGENTGNLYYWNGHRHASTSTRDAQERGGGRIMDLETDYGLKVQQTPGAGMPPLQHNLQSLALQPGAAFQSTKVLPLRLLLVSETHDDTYEGYHSERKALIDLMKPDATRGSQPFVIGYAGANSGKTVWARFRYEDGLGMGQVSGGSIFLENQMPLTLLAVAPFWIEDNRETATLGFFETLTSVNRVIARVNGVWQKLGTGFNGTCFASAYDPITGRVYFGGDFTTANGVTVNGICYWNPATATFTAMDAGVAAAGAVYAIAIAPNGDVWVGGSFLTTGSALTVSVGLARWNLSTGTWTVPTATVTSLVAVYALAIDAQGNLYGGGNFLNFSGNAACDRIFKYTAAGAFAALGTGMSGVVYALAVWQPASKLSLYVGGTFATGNGVTLDNIGVWTDVAATFAPLTNGLSSTVQKIAVAPNGNVYAGGNFATASTPTVTLGLIGMWNGIGWAALGTGIVGTSVWGMTFGPDGLLYVSGDYTSVGPFTTEHPCVWNGSSWQLLDFNSTAAFGIAFTFTVLPNGDLYQGDDTASDRIVGSNTATAAIASTNSVSVFPNFTLLGPTSATLTLKSIKNISSNQTMHFDLIINLGERVLISLQPGNKRVSSDWRGVIPGSPLPSSDFANFILQPTRADGTATNNISAFCTGTVAGALFLMHWVPAHWSVDGAAV